MRRLARHLIIAVLTFTISIALVFLGHGFISPVEKSPADSPSLHVEDVPPAPQEMCEVHGAPMFKEQVPILYGYAPHAFAYETRKDYYQARKQFPNAARWYYAGCVLQDKWFEEVNVCPKCREAQASWAATPIPKSS